MSLHDKKWLPIAALAIVVVAAAISGVFLWVNRPGAQGISPSVQAMAEDAIRSFERAQSVSVAEGASVRQALLAAPTGPPPGMTEEEIHAVRDVGGRVNLTQEEQDALVGKLEEWLSIQARADAETYISWLRGLGYTLSQDAPPDATAAYEFRVGEPMPEDLSREKLFGVLFETGMRHRGGQIRPVHLASDPDAIRIRVQTVRRPGELSGFLRTGEERRKWAGGSGISGRRHWRPPVSMEDLIRGNGSALVAMATLACQGEAGDWYIIAIFAYWEPSTRQWFFENISIPNSPHIWSTFEY